MKGDCVNRLHKGIDLLTGYSRPIKGKEVVNEGLRGFTMKITPVFVGVFLVLSACSGGGGTAVVYAKPGDAIGPGSTFATQDAKRFVIVNGTANLNDQTIQISISDDGQTVTIQQNHKTFTLVDDGSGTFRGDNAVFFLDETGSAVVDIAFFGETTPGYYNGGWVAVGYKTDPIQVAGRTGSATYTGLTRLTARTFALNGFAEGNVFLNANFDTGSITGLMAIRDRGAANADFVVPTTTVTINPSAAANISGNGFVADLDFSPTPAPGDTISFDQSGLTGNFYGVDAVGIGATYWATGTYNGDALFVEGALASDN